MTKNKKKIEEYNLKYFESHKGIGNKNLATKEHLKLTTNYIKRNVSKGVLSELSMFKRTYLCHQMEDNLPAG